MLHAGANEHDHLLKSGMPNGGGLQVWPAVGLSRQTQDADSSYGIQRYGIMERAVSTGDAPSGRSERWCNCLMGLRLCIFLNVEGLLKELQQIAQWGLWG